jgi:hypothetical protein
MKSDLPPPDDTLAAGVRETQLGLSRFMYALGAIIAAAGTTLIMLAFAPNGSQPALVKFRIDQPVLLVGLGLIVFGAAIALAGRVALRHLKQRSPG